MALDYPSVYPSPIVSRLLCFDSGEGRYILEEVFYG
jgi:hypothetical protein